MGLDVGSVSAVEGGNVKIPDCALKSSEAKLVRKEVKKISKINQQYKVDDFGLLFDILIIASPLTKDKSNILFNGIDEEIKIPGSYVPVTVTIVRGILNKTTLGIQSDMRNTLSFELSPKFPFFSIEEVSISDPNSEDIKPVYRIHSQGPITDEFLQTFFIRINEVSRTDWLAVPTMETIPDLGTFQE